MLRWLFSCLMALHLALSAALAHAVPAPRPDVANAAPSSGLSSAVTGRDFREAFGSSFVRTVVALGLADAQNEIGDIFDKGADGGEGSLGHIVLHGIAGCAAAELQGASCSAGAAGGIAQAIYAGTDPLNDGLSPDQVAANAQLIGALAGFAFSGGDPDNVNSASSIAQSAAVNNYLSHTQYEDLIDELEKCDATDGCNRNEILDRWAEVSRDQNLELVACETSECVAGHLEKIIAARDIAQDFADSEYGHELVTHLQTAGDVYSTYLDTNGPRSLLTPYERFEADNCQSVSASTCEGRYQKKIQREFGIFMFMLTAAVPPAALVDGVVSCVGSGGHVGTCVAAAAEAGAGVSNSAIRILLQRLNIPHTIRDNPNSEPRVGTADPRIRGEATNRTGFDDLAQFRDELGLPPAGSATDRSTLAVVEVNGQQIYGINGHGQPVTGVNAISRTHAEIDALNQIQQRGIDVSGQNLTLYVDRTPCKACDQNGGIRSMVEQLGLNQLTVIGPDGPLIIGPR